MSFFESDCKGTLFFHVCKFFTHFLHKNQEVICVSVQKKTLTMSVLIQKAAKRARACLQDYLNEATRLDFTSFTFRRILAGVYSQELWSVANALLNERHYTEDEHVVTTEEVERTALKSICLRGWNCVCETEAISLRMISSRLTRNSRKRYLNFSDD